MRIGLQTNLLRALVAGGGLALVGSAQSLALPHNIVSYGLADTDGDGRSELLLLAADGEVARYAPNSEQWQRRGHLRLPDPAHALWTTADVAATPGEELLVLDSKRLALVRWSEADGEATTESLLARARNRLRVDRPLQVPFAEDLNRDGHIDLLLPSLRGVTPYLQEPNAAALPSFRALELLPTGVQVEVAEGKPGGAYEHTGLLRIAHVATIDLNADGRPDLLTREGSRHGFHLQAADGSFNAPIQVNVREFEDSTPKAAVATGETIVLGDRQMLQRGDVNGDGLADFVIAHRRKIWTFLGGKDGPQFQQAKIQAVADDVSAMLVVDIDGDRCADLLTFQVQVPSVGALLLGLVQSIDVEIRVLGYPSQNGAFAAVPRWRRSLTLRIPAILSLLSQQDELLEKFTAVLGKARLGVRGAFAGGNQRDMALVSADGKTLELRQRKNEGPTLSTEEGRALLRRLLFEDPNTLFDIDRLLGIVAGLLEERSQDLGVDQPPIATIPLRQDPQWRLSDLVVGDLLGVGREQVIAVYERVPEPSEPAANGPLRAFDLLQFPASGK